MLQLFSVKLIRCLGLASPWCLSAGCHYLDETEFHPGATSLIARAPRGRRLYCFERDGGEVMAAIHWEHAAEDRELRAIALRGGRHGPLDRDASAHVHAAAVFALGIVQYRALAAGDSGSLLAPEGVEGGPVTDLIALGFNRAFNGWHLTAQSKSGSRLAAWAALARIRLATRR